MRRGGGSGGGGGGACMEQPVLLLCRRLILLWQLRLFLRCLGASRLLKAGQQPQQGGSGLRVGGGAAAAFVGWLHWACVAPPR